jgi:hypothetical protein
VFSSRYKGRKLNPRGIPKGMTEKIVMMKNANLNKTFLDQRLCLNGEAWINCVFDGCIVELQLIPSFTKLVDCYFIDCKLIGDGWPNDVLEAFKAGHTFFGGSVRHIIR